MPKDDANLIIDITGNTAGIATDYTTEGVTNQHVQIVKVAWGEPEVANRVTTDSPLPVNMVSGNTLAVSGTIGGTGNFSVINSSGNPFRIAGETGAIPVGISGSIQGISGGVLVGITGTMRLGNTYIAIQGVSGGYPVAITGGRGLSALTDSITVQGTVGITGGRYLLPAFDGVKVYSHSAGLTIPVQLFGSGGLVGMSGTALNVNLVGAGITATVSVAAIVGISQADQATPLFIAGATAGPRVRVQGSLTGGALEVGWVNPLPVSINQSLLGITFNDENIVDSLTTINTNVTTVKNYLVNDVVTSINNISNKLPGAGVFNTKTTLNLPTAFYTGEVSLGITGETQLSSNTLYNGITIKAPLSNGTYDIRVRSSNSSSYYLLSPGETIFLSIDNTNKVIFSSNGTSVRANYIAS